MMEQKKHLGRKWIIVICAAAAIVLMLIIGAMQRQKHAGSENGDSVKAVRVQKGTITNTVTASGTLEDNDTTDIRIPSALTVDEVLVEEGDTIKKGDALATVDLTSVKEEIYNVRKSLSDISSTLKSIRSKTGSEYTAQREMLYAQRSDLNKELTDLNRINKSGKITSTVSGTIDSVSISGTSSQTSQSSGSSSQSSADMSSISGLSGLTGVSASDDTMQASQMSLKIPVNTGNTGSQITGNNKPDITIPQDESNRKSSDKSQSSASSGSQSAVPDISAYTGNTGTGKTDSVQNNTSDSYTANQGNVSIPSVSSGNSTQQMPAGSSSSLQGLGSASTSTDSNLSSTTGVSLQSAFSVSTGDKMKISLSVDELDILNVSEGQSVKVTLDAIDDQEFDGEITKVSHVGTNNGGSAKYDVTCEIDRTDEMLVGMNATAVITVDSASDVLTIPLAAVQEENGSSYVYTASDNGTLSGRKQITTGLSDDSTVEITEGLSEGESVYYKDLSGQELTSSQNNMMNMRDNMQQNSRNGDGGRGENDNGTGTPPSGGPGGNGGN